MKFKKLSMLLILTLLMCTIFTACSNKPDDTSATPTPPNPGHVDSLPEGSVIVDINALCSGAGEANAAGWIPTNIYIDTVQKQYEQSQDENLKLVLEYAETPISSAYIFLGMKFSESTVTYAYEATEVGTENIVIVYVEISSGGATNITTGTVEDKDQIILGVTNSSTEENTDSSDTTESNTNTDAENTDKAVIDTLSAGVAEILD